MERDKPKGKQPDYKSDGVAVWINLDKNGNKYLSIWLLDGSIRVNAFKNEPKPKEKPIKEELVL